MAKLALLALAFTAIVAFSEVSAYRTTITTTTVEDNGFPPYDWSSGGITTVKDNGFPPDYWSSGGIWDPIASPQQCRRQIQSKQLALDHCQMHITQQSPFESKLRTLVAANPSQQEPHLQLCCNQLKNVAQPCQCEAIQQVFEQAQQQQQQKKQGGRQGRQQGGQQQMQQMLRKAEQLPNDCKLQVQQCPIQSPRV